MLTTIDVLDAAATLGRSYRDFRRYVQELLAEGKATGSLQTESRLQFTVLNEHRQNRLDKTIELIPELRRAVKAIRRHQTSIVLSEGWCGDSAQVLPVLSKIEESSEANVDLKILVAAENPELMNRYLSNGKRSVPKLIIFDTASGEELVRWGPRPEMALHTWYAGDRTIEIQKELAELLT